MTGVESRTWFQAVFDCIFLTSSCSIFTVTAVLYPSQVPGMSLFLMIVSIVQSYLHMMCLPYLVPVANMAMTGKDNKKSFSAEWKNNYDKDFTNSCLGLVPSMIFFQLLGRDSDSQ